MHRIIFLFLSFSFSSSSSRCNSNNLFWLGPLPIQCLNSAEMNGYQNYVNNHLIAFQKYLGRLVLFQKSHYSPLYNFKPPDLFQDVKGAYKKREHDVLHTQDQWEWFQTERGKFYIICQGAILCSVRHFKRLLRGVVDASSVAMFKATLEGTLGSLVQ